MTSRSRRLSVAHRALNRSRRRRRSAAPRHGRPEEAVVMGRLKDQAADSTEAINADVDCHARRSSLRTEEQTACQMQAWVWLWQKNQCFATRMAIDQTREVRVPTCDSARRWATPHTLRGPAGGRSVHSRGASTRKWAVTRIGEGLPERSPGGGIHHRGQAALPSGSRAPGSCLAPPSGTADRGARRHPRRGACRSVTHSAMAGHVQFERE